MSKLERFIRRMLAQRECLNFAAKKLGDLASGSGARFGKRPYLRFLLLTVVELFKGLGSIYKVKTPHEVGLKTGCLLMVRS